MTTDFSSIIDTLFAAVNSKGAAWSESDLAPYAHEACTFNGKPISRAEMAAGTAASFAGSNKIVYSYELKSVEQDAGKTDDGKMKQKTVGVMTITPIDADGKQIEGAPVFKEEITHIWVDGKVLEIQSGRSMEDLEAERTKVIGKTA